MTSRLGRPPLVRTTNEEGTEFSVNVGGVEHTFRKGSDGRIRAIGATSRIAAIADDRAFAQGRVREQLTAVALNADVTDAVSE